MMVCFYFYFMYVVFYLHVCVPLACLVPSEARRGCQDVLTLELGADL